MKAYTGKVVVVTGANSGIGEAIAVALHEAGAQVVALARRQEALEAAQKRHPHLRWMLADVVDEARINTVMADIKRAFGRLDGVVNNAAIFFPTPLEQSSADRVRQQFEVNVFGVTNVARAALPLLRDSRGFILNISSAAGHKAAAGAAHYGATKAAVESLTRSWALELAPLGIRVNAVAPGPVDTPVFEKIGVPAEAVPQLKAAFVKQVPLGRMGSTEEVARWVVQLADPQVTWITGQVLSVDGGMSLT